MNNDLPPIKPFIDYLEVKGKPIWEKLFTISIEQRHLRSVEEIKLFGMPTTGDSELDRLSMNQLTTIMITINDMAEYFRKGISFNIVNHEDSKVIYDIITDYLAEWNRKLDIAINVKQAPIEDLKLLDSLASKIHGHAANYFIPEDSVRDIIQDLGGKPGQWFTRNTLNTIPKQQDKEFKPDNYVSFGDIIQEKSARRFSFVNKRG